MSNIELFDSFLNGQMPDTEIGKFQHQLDIDKELAGDFKIYLATINGFCREEQEDNIEFASAMKALSSQQLKDIIGVKQRKVIKKGDISRPNMLWITSMVAMVIVFFSISVNIQKRSNISKDLLIAEYNAIQTGDRGSGDIFDLIAMSENDIKEQIPLLFEKFQSIPNNEIQSKQIAGINLAMAFLKIHDRKKSIQTLNTLKGLYPDDEEFVAQCDKIINQLIQ